MSEQTMPRVEGDRKAPSVTTVLGRFLERARPLRTMPVWARYTITAVVVLAAAWIDYAAGPSFPYPSLPFVVAIAIVSFLFDRGSGILATVLSAFFGWFLFPETGAREYLSLAFLLAFGVFMASIIEALRFSVEQLAEANEDLQMSRDEVRLNLSILESIIESNPDPICVKDLEGRYVHCNSAFARFRGVPGHLLIGKRARDFRSNVEARFIEEAENKVIDSKTAFSTEAQLEVGGEPRWYLTSIAPWYGPSGELAGLVETARDISKRKRAEDRIKAANDQKQVLLQDVHHRVKNHFQSAIAMLSMEMRSLSDPVAKDVAKGTINRLSVLGRAYDRLWIGEENEAIVNASTFIEDLCEDLRSSMIGNRPIGLVVKAEPAPIEATRATALGLFINEALTNAVKHAFPEGRNGSVRVNFARQDGSFRLEVADDGIGATGDSASGTGTKLMGIFSQQLKGTFERRGRPGTALILTFPAEQ